MNHDFNKFDSARTCLGDYTKFVALHEVLRPRRIAHPPKEDDWLSTRPI